MSTVYKLPNKDDINDQASLWIAKIDRNLTEDEKKALVRWVNQSPLHANSLYKMAHLWDKMDDLSRLADLFEAPTQPKQKAGWRTPIAVAASLLVGILSVTLFTSQSGVFDRHTTQHLAINTFETAIGEQSQVTLPDSSVLTLNTNTLVKVNYTPNARVLTLLRGELHIKVAHNTKRPLSVIAQDKLVQAVGTAFNVQIVGTKEVELIVTDGKVVVAEGTEVDALAHTSLPTKKQKHAVSVGQKLLIGAPDANIAKLDSQSISAETSWQQGNIVFSGETLETALKEIERYTPTHFEISDPTLKHIRIAGMFKAGDIDGLTAALKQNFDINAKKIGEETIILGRSL